MSCSCRCPLAAWSQSTDHPSNGMADYYSRGTWCVCSTPCTMGILHASGFANQYRGWPATKISPCTSEARSLHGQDYRIDLQKLCQSFLLPWSHDQDRHGEGMQLHQREKLAPRNQQPASSNHLDTRSQHQGGSDRPLHTVSMQGSGNQSPQPWYSSLKVNCGPRWVTIRGVVIHSLDSTLVDARSHQSGSAFPGESHGFVCLC